MISVACFSIVCDSMRKSLIALQTEDIKASCNVTEWLVFGQHNPSNSMAKNNRCVFCRETEKKRSDLPEHGLHHPEGYLIRMPVGAEKSCSVPVSRSSMACGISNSTGAARKH